MTPDVPVVPTRGGQNSGGCRGRRREWVGTNERRRVRVTGQKVRELTHYWGGRDPQTEYDKGDDEVDRSSVRTSQEFSGSYQRR